MRAFVKVTNGCFPNVNFFLAWEAFNTMGYNVTLFEEKDIDNLDISVDTPVFAGVTVFRKVIDKLGINYPPFDCYPTVLNPYYGRTLQKSTLGEVRNKFLKDNIPVFVKPIKPKEFTGVVINSMLNLIPIANKKDDIPVYVCEPIDILSEFRVYVHDGDILGVKHYYGKWWWCPDKMFVDMIVGKYKPSPISYGIDIGVADTEGRCFVIEVNDGCNLGNYGLDSIKYGEMIVARWFEIMSQSKVTDIISKDVKGHERDESFIKQFSPCKTLKEMMIENIIGDLKEKSLKAYAEEIINNVKETDSKTNI